MWGITVEGRCIVTGIVHTSDTLFYMVARSIGPHETSLLL